MTNRKGYWLLCGLVAVGCARPPVSPPTTPPAQLGSRYDVQVWITPRQCAARCDRTVLGAVHAAVGAGF